MLLIFIIFLGPEKMKNYGQEQIYVIRWRPSQCSVDPIEEIILDLVDYHFVARQPALIEKIGLIDQVILLLHGCTVLKSICVYLSPAITFYR